MESKRGLSTIVTTLIILLLVLVSVGIIWGVVNNLLEKGESEGDNFAKCLGIQIKATKVMNSSMGDDYVVTASREPRGEGEYGAKIIFYNESGDRSNTSEFSEMFFSFQTHVEFFEDTGVVNANKVEILPFYIDDSGNQKVCNNLNSLEFNLAGSSGSAPVIPVVPTVSCNDLNFEPITEIVWSTLPGGIIYYLLLSNSQGTPVGLLGNFSNSTEQINNIPASDSYLVVPVSPQIYSSVASPYFLANISNPTNVILTPVLGDGTECISDSFTINSIIAN